MQVFVPTPSFTEAIQRSFFFGFCKTEEKENRLHFFFERRDCKHFRRDFYTGTIFKVSQTEGEKENLNREIFFLAIRRERKRRKKNRQQSTWSLPSEKWISLEKHFRGRMSFLRRLLLQRDPTSTEKLQNGLVNEEVCKIVATHK